MSVCHTSTSLVYMRSTYIWKGLVHVVPVAFSESGCFLCEWGAFLWLLFHLNCSVCFKRKENQACMVTSGQLTGWQQAMQTRTASQALKHPPQNLKQCFTVPTPEQNPKPGPRAQPEAVLATLTSGWPNTILEL